MSTGTLTVYQAFDVLTDLVALTRIETSDAASTVFVDDPANPAVRIVFASDPAVPGFAIWDATGTTLYAIGDYASVTTFDSALTDGGVDGARAVLLGGLTTLALAPDATADLASVKQGLVIEGNDLDTAFAVSQGAATVHAGGGDDSISLWAGFSEGHFDGGDGSDTIWLDGPVAIMVAVAGHKISVMYLPPTWIVETYIRTFDSIEFFRGSAGIQNFYSLGEGMRFEGGGGPDQFVLLGGPALTDIVDYGGETGSKGIVVNLGYDPVTSPAIDGELEAARTVVLDGDALPPMGFVRDTFGAIDNLSTGLIVEGTARADVFYGSSVADAFVGDAGEDHFFGGDGNDRIEGGAGDDVVYFTGAPDDYEVTFDADVFTIAAKDGSGTDEVSGVERFRFAGIDFTAAELAPVVANPPMAADDDNSGDAVIEAAAGDAGDASAQGNVLANDSDADGDALSVTDVRVGTDGAFAAVGASTVVAGLYGFLTIAVDGMWSYALDDNKALTNALQGGTTVHDVFAYRIGAGGDFAEAALDIAIAGSNDVPIAAADSLTTNEDVPLVVAASSLTNNDSDPEDGTVSFLAVGGGSHGTVALSAGIVTFTPTADYHGTAGFSYTVRDAQGATTTQQVDVVVRGVNDAPHAKADSGSGLTTAEDTVLGISAARLLGNDGDADNDALAVASVSSGVGGTAVLNANGSISFTPAANFNGEARFTYRVKDGAGAVSAPAAAVVEVTPVNDAPSFGSRVGPAAAPAIRENTTAVTILSAFDIDSAVVSFSVAGPDAAAFAIDGDMLRFAAPADFEAPRDRGGDNVYDVTLIASDGALTDARTFAIGVLDAAGNTIRGTRMNDRIDESHTLGGKSATSEEDRIDGRKGRDYIAGGDGNDTLTGGKSGDRLRGDGGDDLLRGGAGKDKIDGGEGQDSADYSDATAAVSVALAGSHNARVRIGDVMDDTLKNVENVIGGKRADALSGDSSDNVLMGNRGKDVLAGRLGADTLSGGSGHDQFVFDARLRVSNTDVVTDFRHNADLLVLDDRIFKAIGAKLNKREFYAGDDADQAHDRNDRIVYDTATGKLYYDADGHRAGHAAVHFATLSGAPALDAGDFLIV